MLKSIKVITTSIILTVFILSCSKEKQSSTQGGGLFKFKVTFNPPIPNNPAIADKVNLVYIYTNLPELGIYNWVTSSSNPKPEPFTNYESPEISVTKGQNVSITGISLTNFGDLGCVQTKIEGIQNSRITKTVILNLGYSNATTQCKDFNNTKINFIID